MSYVGRKPAEAPLTSADITDGIITNADVASDAAIAASKLSGVVTPSYTGDIDITGEMLADSYNETLSTVTSSSNAATLDLESANVFTHTLSEDVTYTFSNPPTTGTAYGFTLKVVQDATARTITWPASVDWVDATAPTLSTGSGEVDVFTFFTHDGGTTYYGFVAGQVLS